MHGRLFSLSRYSSLPEGMAGPKAACVVSKKVSLKAVVRNTIERRCREAIRKNAKNMHKDTVYIFHAKKEAASALFSDINSDVEVLLNKH